ncbi:uncharacterized protein LOC130244763 [Danio aesculapii]|uniref:uncharacterized protein LOC130244763 n=1 Tax=Danio aesculapii TaxID=1142201 RepID=UPI0024C064A3|nr:uncharacterized protein LOC130244763 [Danio aesculapii]
MAQATKVVKSIPPTVVDAPARAVHPEFLTARSHGFLRIMNRPAQWVVIITLLISWSVAGVVMFDFVSDDQIASIQDLGSDPGLAVNKAIEGIENRINHMNDVFNDANEYIAELIYNPKEALYSAVDSSLSYVTEMLTPDELIIETVKYGGTVFDEATEWVRFPVCFLFHLFEDILDIVFTPVDLLSEAVVQILSGIKAIAQYLSNMFEGTKGITDIAKLGGTLLDKVTDCIRFPVGYLFYLFEAILDVTIIYPADMASEAFLQILNVIKDTLASIFGFLKGDADITETAKLGGAVLDTVTDWIRLPVGYLFYLFEAILDVTIIYPADMASEAFLQVLNVIKNTLSTLFGFLEAWFPKMSTRPTELVEKVAEEATDVKTTMSNYLSSLFAGDEDGIPDVTFDPMKVVTDTVEEFADRRDMLLAYLSNMLMEDKVSDETPQVIRRKGEFLPPMEKVAEVLGKTQDPIYAAYIAVRSTAEIDGDKLEINEAEVDSAEDILVEQKVEKTVDRSENDAVASVEEEKAVGDIVDEEPFHTPEVTDEETATEKDEDTFDSNETTSDVQDIDNAIDAETEEIPEMVESVSDVGEEEPFEVTNEETATEQVEDTADSNEITSNAADMQDVDNISDVDTEEIPKTVGDVSDVGEEEPSEVIDEVMATEKIEDVSGSTRLTSNAADVKDTDDTSDAVTDKDEIKTVEDFSEVTEEEISDVPEVIDEEMVEKSDDSFHFAEDKPTELISDAPDVTEDIDDISDDKVSAVSEENESIQEATKTVSDVTENETSDMTDVVDEEMEAGKADDISHFVEDESIEITSDATVGKEDTDAFTVTEEKETIESLQEAAMKMSQNADEEIPNVTKMVEEPDTSDFMDELEEPEKDEDEISVTNDQVETAQDVIFPKEKVEAAELDDHDKLKAKDGSQVDDIKKEVVEIADADNDLQNELDKDEIKVEDASDQTILASTAAEEDHDDDGAPVLLTVQHEHSDRDDKNNNNNDRKRDARGLIKRKTPKSHSTETDEQNAHKDLHKESDKVLEQVKEAKEKKAREEIYKIIQEMREEKAEGVEEEIVLQQINITVEKVKKEETVKKEEKAKRKEKAQEPKGAAKKVKPAKKDDAVKKEAKTEDAKISKDKTKAVPVKKGM